MPAAAPGDAGEDVAEDAAEELAEERGVAFDTAGAFYRRESMYGRDCAALDIYVAASTLALHPGIADAIITHRYPLEAAEEAFRTAADRSAGAIKVVLEP